MKRQWDLYDLAEHWTLSSTELALLANKTGPTRLGFALLLKFFQHEGRQHEGRFPQAKHDIPGAVVGHVATQVGVPPEHYLQYDWSGRAIKYHRAQIRAFLGFREATVQDSQDLAEWLCAQVLPQHHRHEHLQEAVYQRCHDEHIEPPTPDRVERLIHSALHTFEERLCRSVYERLPPETLAALDALVSMDEPPDPDGDGAAGRGTSRLHSLRTDPGRIALDSVLVEIEKLVCLRQLQLPMDLFAHLAPAVLTRYRQRAAAESPSELRAHAAPVRALLLAAVCTQRRQEIADSLIDLLIGVVQKIGARAERKVETELLSDLKRVAGKTTLLYQIADASVTNPKGIVEEVVFPAAGGAQTLHDLVKEYKATGPAYRRMLSHILDALEFRSNNAVHQPVIQALALLKRNAGSKRRYYARAEDIPLDGVVPPGWLELVVGADRKGHPRVERIAYELCVLQAVREKVRCRELWVVDGRRFGNPDDDLPGDFAAERETYFAALQLPTDADIFIGGLQQAMTKALTTLHRGLPKNKHVQILPTRNGRIKLSPLDPQPEPVNLARLKAEVMRRWPMTSLLDILKEVELRVGLTDLFTSVASREALEPETLQRRLLLCLYALGTNTGLKRIAAGEYEETFEDLRYVRRRFITRDHLRAANVQVVNAILQARLPYIWGEGTTACAADAKRFGAWDQNLLTAFHARYRRPGVLIYWHVERKAICIYSQLKACASSEVAAMIEGVLRHCTEMAVQKAYTDSHGQSGIGFAFTHLLGFQLLPRLKGLHKQKLYRPLAGQPEAYPRLQPVLTRPINWTLIRQQYDEMVKFATALRLGTADAESILRRFTRTAPQHPTYQALAELGKAVKTIFLCEYLHAEALRQEINDGLQVIETWNSTNNFIFFGKGGEIATNRFEDQEAAALALQLLQNSLVLINTLMLQSILADPAWLARMTPEDLRALSPLLFAHVNPYGTFRLDLHERLVLEEAG
jgi:TnpA family transposase